MDSEEPAATGTPGRRRQTVVAAVALAVLVLTAVVFYQWGRADPPAAPVAVPSPTPSATRPPTVAEIYTAVAPSMVSIETVRTDGSAVTGTGVIVNADGSVLTALHVVRDAKMIKLMFADGTAATATVVDSDPKIDTATLAPAGLPSVVVPAVLGNSSRLAVGDAVIAIGDQLGLTRSTTTGIVSGLNRGSTNPEGITLSGLIQFDAAVNHGSSGGPLLNGDGEVVGIVVALANPTSSGTFVGIGFAVPIAAATGGGGDRGPQQ